MRAVLLVLAVLAAGCAVEEPSTALPPATHATDCAAAPDAETCRAPTERTPLGVRTFPAGNRSRVGLVLENEGDVPLRFDADPPAFALYARPADAWTKVASGRGGDTPGVALAPGENATLVLHYGKVRAGDRSNDVAYAVEEPNPWPEGVYRACFSAHPGAASEWVRGCKDFRIR